jgi:hypothetical protein
MQNRENTENIKDEDIGRTNMRAYKIFRPVNGTVHKRSVFDPNYRHEITCNDSNSNKLLKMEAKSTAERRVDQRDKVSIERTMQRTATTVHN